MNNKITPPWLKGLIISFILILLSIAVELLNLSQNKPIQWLQVALIIIAIIWSCLIYGKEMDHLVSFGNIFAHGFKVTAALTVISIFYTIIALKYIFPDIMVRALEQARTQMYKSGNLSDAEIEKGIEFTKKFFMPFTIGGLLLMYTLIGAFSSLIGAAVTKKKALDNPFDQK